jgi:multicomponent Na+:H+ antiporter subunit G
MDSLANAATHASNGLSFSLAVTFFFFGGATILVGAVGVLRFRDVYMRLHAVALVSALGAPLLLAGFAAAAWDWRITLKLLLLGGLIAALAPAASHILASAAHGSGLAPRMDASP